MIRRNFYTFLNLLFTLFISFTAPAQHEVPLYAGTIPNSKPSKNSEKVEESNGRTMVIRISKPTLTMYAAKASSTGTAVLICPGGGYWKNAIAHEGHDVAKKLSENGVTAFVLKYRIPNDSTMTDRETGPLQDAQQALTVIRANAEKYGIDANKLGIMGFSAGGHLASTAGTHFESPVLKTGANVRPDFMILIYPVISFVDSIGHMGSRNQLIGKNPSLDKIYQYSNEFRITPRTPPTFLVHATDDDVVKVENSLRFYENLVKNKVKAELHIYQAGGHGFGMINWTTADLWMDRCLNWLRSNNLLPSH